MALITHTLATRSPIGTQLQQSDTHQVEDVSITNSTDSSHQPAVALSDTL